MIKTLFLCLSINFILGAALVSDKSLFFDDNQLFDLILRSPREDDDFRDDRAIRLFEESIFNNDIKKVQKFLESDFNINWRLDGGRTALHIACANGHTEMVQFLLKNKAQLEIADYSNNKTPIFEAIENGNFDIVSTLINAKANIGARMSNGYSALTIVSKPEIAKLLLEKNSALLDEQDKGTTKFTALHEACRFWRFQTINTLISWGANLDIRDHASKKAVDYLNFDLKANLFDKIKFCKLDFNEALSSLPEPVKRIIIKYFGTNSYLACEIS